MTENLAISEQELFDEITDRAIDEGVTDAEAFGQLVEAVINEHIDAGELDKDDDTEGMEDRIKDRWGEFEQRLNEQVAWLVHSL